MTRVSSRELAAAIVDIEGESVSRLAGEYATPVAEIIDRIEARLEREAARVEGVRR